MNEKYQLCVSALGGVVCYLRSCLIERPLLALRRFTFFTPTDMQSATKGGDVDFSHPGQKMVLDETAYRNLEVSHVSRSSFYEVAPHIVFDIFIINLATQGRDAIYRFLMKHSYERMRPMEII